jgi:predicted metal-dependent HD superfamily phosphohydrolase
VLRRYPDDVRGVIDRACSVPVINEILMRLRSELSPALRYHSFEHTLDVLSEAIYFALTDQLPQREIELLAVAAAYHDAGFLKQWAHNEPIGAEMAADAMRAAGDYSEEEIALVVSMILDTQLNDNGADYGERAHSRLARYLLDADMSNLGRGDFKEKLALLSEEFDADALKQMTQTYTLLQNHCWLTPAGRTLREQQKSKNLVELKRQLQE